MAPLEVICASFGRSGTDSLRVALNKLGYNTHHMRTMIADQSSATLFTQAYRHPEEEADWDHIYEGYTAACDWPTVSFMTPLMKKYPDAKILLIVRDPDSWYQSIKNTVYKHHRKVAESSNGSMKNLLEMIQTIVLDGAFGNPAMFEDEEAIKRKFVEHIEWVKKTVPKDNLLVMELGEGWDRMCQFLGKPVPEEPYPHTNSTQEILKSINDLVNEQKAAAEAAAT
ncbi:P-loop containing nucleoside triphosphate hydrolase protein [Phascolomyces articulosus]|uniref:P-loop containing nucleoside triphosphate hydrolase protein n=1 Tax=Phascolomyces articulosus TaxID=60185 RepID=A0AAD5PGE3_9FUNG|nr:P-loop containing nucleoside triphosphate hydrolase protein [Phascolomyces articulosus]